jgi:hypothetical protein
MSSATIKKLKDIKLYSIDELKELHGMSTDKGVYTENDINDIFDIHKSKYPNLARPGGFLDKARNRILRDLDMNTESGNNPVIESFTNSSSTPPPSQADDWLENQYLQQDDETQNIKLTDRKGKVQIFDSDGPDGHNAMKQEQLGIINSRVQEFVQDSLNPTLKNTTERLLVIDSLFRQIITPYSPNPASPASSSTFTMDLSEPLVNVLSMKLYSYQIPYSWYTIDSAYGTSCFWVKANGGSPTLIQVDNGNYTPIQLISAIQDQFTAVLNNGAFMGNNFDISYNPISGKSWMSFTTTLPSYSAELIFYDSSNENNCRGVYCGNMMRLNSNLGWILGFRPETDTRTPIVFSRSISSNSGTSPPMKLYSDTTVDTYGSKYIVVVLDDLNQNRLNSGVVNIVDTSTTLSVPDYFNASIPNVCAPDPQLNNVLSPFYVASTPRTLTSKQLYSINSILDNRKNTYKYRSSAPSTSDVFALIYPKKGGVNSGDMMVDLGSSLAYNRRMYFGPVNIERLRISLQDDKGNILNMNGADWSISIIVEQLYQY